MTTTPEANPNAAAGYVVDRVVVCDAYREPIRFYRLLSAGRSRLEDGRRPSMRYLASAKATKGGLQALLGRQVGLFEDQLGSGEQLNEVVNQLRDEVRQWRDGGYVGTSRVTGRLLEWWFERDEERKREMKRFFFCQREAVETVIYLYEVRHRQPMPETGDLVRYALKLATGTGKTLVMALLIVWSCLHKRRVIGSSLSENVLILTPNLTVRDRVWGTDPLTQLPTGAGLNPRSPENLYDTFDMVPPELRPEFRPNVIVRNWQSIPFEADREDWVDGQSIGAGRFVPASVIWSIQRRERATRDPRAAMRRVLGNWRDLIVVNDEAHHVWGEKRRDSDGETNTIVWSQILDRIAQAASLQLVVDMSATPWYPSGAQKPEGTLFEWLISDFSVFDAFESGLVKVVRLPDPDEAGRRYLDIWDDVKGARTKAEYIAASRGAIASIYAAWRHEYDIWASQLAWEGRDPPPVLLIVADRAERARWLFEHVTEEYELLGNGDSDDPRTWVTVQVDSKVFDAEKGNEAILREMVNTVGRAGKAGERVRCIVSVNMLAEGWDVKNVTHILGLRAFGSPLLTEQVIGRGLRRVDYSAINVPIEERLANPNRPDEETVDAFGIPFVGFPVERRKRPAIKGWATRSTAIVADPSKADFALSIPNVRAWGVSVRRPLAEVVGIETLPRITLDPRETPPNVPVRPVVGDGPGLVLTPEEFRREFPVLRTTLLIAKDLHDRVAPEVGGLLVGPAFDEVHDFVQAYVARRVAAIDPSDDRDIGIPYWRQQIIDILATALLDAPLDLVTLPIYGDPRTFETAHVSEFRWPGLTGLGRKTHLSAVACHTGLEVAFADFLDGARDVTSYVKNERLGFSVTYYEANRPRQYFPDFVVRDREEVSWVIETKGEVHPNTVLKSEAATIWCDRMTRSGESQWRYLFVQQQVLEKALRAGIRTVQELDDHVQTARMAKEVTYPTVDEHYGATRRAADKPNGQR